MPPPVLARRIKGLVSRPSEFPDVLTVTVRVLAKLTSSSRGANMAGPQAAFHHSSTLCDAIAHHLPHRQVEKLWNTPTQSDSYEVDLSSIDKLAAFAALGNIFQVEQLLSYGIDPNIGSEYLGYPVEQAARNNYPEIASVG